MKLADGSKGLSCLSVFEKAFTELFVDKLEDVDLLSGNTRKMLRTSSSTLDLA
jgi:hypothetical protein